MPLRCCFVCLRIASCVCVVSVCASALLVVCAFALLVVFAFALLGVCASILLFVCASALLIVCLCIAGCASVHCKVCVLSFGSDVCLSIATSCVALHCIPTVYM